jgi:hypothetical protein
MTPEKFVQYVKKDIAKKSVKLKLVNALTIKDDYGIPLNGFFDEQELAVAVGSPVEKWLPILVHEYGHFRQWKEQCRPWRNTYVNGEDIYDTVFTWIKKKKRYNLADVKKYTARARDLEVDCERKAVKIIRECKLQNYIPLSAYISKANSYLYFYNYALLKRRWWKKGHAPYNNPDVWTNFPPFFKQRYCQLPKRYIELYDKYC